MIFSENRYPLFGIMLEAAGERVTKPLSEAARTALMGVSTATLTTQLFKRGLRNTFIQGARPLNPDAPPMVGPAYTLRYIPAREDIDTLDVFADRTHPQRAAVEAIPPGSVLVMDCRRRLRRQHPGDAHDDPRRGRRGERRRPAR